MNQEQKTETVIAIDFYCDLCGKDGLKLNPAAYDAKTKVGSWAFMCEPCFKKWGVGLGLGKGQRLIKEHKNG